MSTSFTQHTGDEGVRSYLAPQDYIDKSHVQAFVDDVQVTQSESLTPTTFILEDISGSIYATFGSSIILQGFTIDLKRVTPEASIINFVNGTTNQASDFNTSFQQSSYIAVEVREQTSVFGGSAIYYSKTESDGRFANRQTTEDRFTATDADIALKADQSSVSNVDNTSDVNKPVSTAQQAALDLKADQSVVDLIIPAPTGSILHFAAETPPTGWLKANGSEVSRTTYADLYAVIGDTFGAGDGSTTFLLPDLRGEFLRGLDDGRGVDTGRLIGSSQDDTLQGHKHKTVNYSGTAGATDFNSQFGGEISTNTNLGGLSGKATGYSIYTAGADIDDGTNGTPRTASETRPRNVAMLAIIKT